MTAFLVCYELVTFLGPASVQCFTSVRLQLEASPKAISRRTSYLRVRLEFLRYPHLITTFFNTCVFGPPKPFTVPSTWTWIGHPVSGLLIPTLRPIQTWFPFGSVPYEHLTLLVVLTRRTVLQKVRSQPCGLPLFVSTRFQVLFHSPPGVLFTFPSQYYALSVTREYLGLGGGPPGFPQGFSCPVVLWILQRVFCFRLLGFHRLWLAFPKQFG